ncbi:MAG: glycosyltransferase family 39 protein [Blastocatellia bacterium]|nr:glycosyltransferase family 39 protein [Blastocatellia bacterium]
MKAADEFPHSSTKSRLQRLLAAFCNNDRRLVLALFFLGIVTRFIAIPASLWEWDEILFARSLSKYDIAAHSPHPPGFPVFVVLGRAIYWITGNEHSALTTLAFIFAVFVPPALFYLFRDIFKDRRIAFAAALLCSFTPNIWVHGGAGRSDGVAFTLGIIGLILVIRGFNSNRSLIAGCAVFGIGMGVRTTLLPVMGPLIAIVFLARIRRREWRVVAAATATATISIIVWYVPMVYHTTWPIYRSLVKMHSQGIWEKDSLFSHHESSEVSFRVRRFFADIWGTKWIKDSFYMLSALGLLALAIERQWRAISLMAIAFLPYLIFTFVLNAPIAGTLYSMPYMPFFTGLAACGLIIPPRWLFHYVRWKPLENLGLAFALCLTFAIAGWAYPIINLMHHEVSPPVRAFEYLKKTLDPENDLLSYYASFLPYVSFYLPNQKAIMLEEDLDPEANLIRPQAGAHRLISLTSNPILGAQGEHFLWDSDLGARRLSRLSLDRFSSAHIADTTRPRGILFLSGWYPVEGDQNGNWRWMRPQGKVALQHLADSMIVHLRGSIIYPPSPQQRPTLIFRLNGIEIDRIVIERSEFAHRLAIKPDPSFYWSVLSLEIDKTVPRSERNQRDTDVLGFKCFEFDLSPAPGAEMINSSPDRYFGAGWSGVENNGESCWRRINESAIAYLPAIEGDGRLDLTLIIPQELQGAEREVAVEAGGVILGRFRPPTGYFTKSFEVQKSIHRGKKLELKLSLPNAGSKTSAVQIYYLGWRPSKKASMEHR